MFGFWKKKKTEPNTEEPEKKGKKHTHVDKLLMGAIVGAAVGSVVGMSVNNQRHKKPENNQPEKTVINPKSLKKIPNEVE